MAGIELTTSDTMSALEVARREKMSDDNIHIIEALSIDNEILLDAPFAEANEGDSETGIIRETIPGISHRRINEGVKVGTSKTKLTHDVICQSSVYSRVDMTLVRRTKNPKQLLNSESVGFIQAMGQDQAADIMYGNNALDPSNMTGFAPRYAAYDDKYCVNMGGTGNACTSIWIVRWDQEKCKLIYPRGSKSIGIVASDHGEQRIDVEDGKSLQMYENYYEANYGLTVKDRRNVIRLANIDKTVSMTKVVDQILKSEYALASGSGTVCIYANADILGEFRVLCANKTGTVYTMDTPWGNKVLAIDTMRIRKVNAILNTESAVGAAA